MDPATIFQVIGTALSLGDVVVKSIMKLRSIKARYQGAPLVLSTMIGQLFIVKSALDQLGDFNRPEHRQHPRYQQLSEQIGSALDSFALLILALEQRLEQFEATEPTAMRVKERLAFLWNDKDMSEYSMLLDRQVNALTLLLQAMQCISWPQQYELMRMEENVEILSLAADCSTSLMGIDDSSISFVSEDTDLISLRFDFDRIILDSRIYRQAQRSHLRETIRAAKMNARIPTAEPFADASASQRTFENTHEPTDSTFEEVQVSLLEASKPPGADIHGAPSASLETAGITQSSTFLDLDEHDDQSDHETIDISPKRNSDPFPTTKRRISFRRSAWWRKPPTSKTTFEVGKVTRLSSVTSINTSIDVQEPMEEPMEEPKEAPKEESMEEPMEEPREKPRKVLLLGIGDSGKSTISKTIQIYQQKLKVDSRDNIRDGILSNLVDSTHIVVNELESLGIALDDRDLEDAARDFYGDLDRARLLWKDCGFRRAYQSVLQRRQSLDNAGFFATNIERIMSPNYTPTEQDVVHYRTKTAGIEKQEVMYEGLEWELIEAGGARSQRKKWVHTFPDAFAVMFAIDATSYAKRLNEDEDGNCLYEAIAVFQSLIVSSWFLKSRFIIVFTKCDQIEDMLLKCPPEDYCQNYPTQVGSSSVEQYFDHLEALLLTEDPIPLDRRCCFVRARFDDIAAHNPATEILEALHQSTMAYVLKP